MLFRDYQTLHLVVNFLLFGVLCLAFLGLAVSENDKVAQHRSDVQPISLQGRDVEGVFAFAAMSLQRCCTLARLKPAFVQRRLLAKLPLKAAHHSLCCAPLPPAATPTPATPAAKQLQGSGSNQFPYPSCTWWATQRFFQLHGVYVPWHTQADAWQWTARAYQFGWHVSAQPSVGAIIDLQPWVQGAYGLGHVAVVERLLGNGKVIASNMNWGGHPYQVTNVEFSAGPGVTFITS